MIKTSATVLLIALTALPLSARADDATAPPDFDARALRAHVEFLADDLLEGRNTGTRGYDLAARYVASIFAMAGLEPAGDKDSWFQYFDTVEGRLVADSATMTLRTAGGDELPMVWHEDYVLGGSYVDAETRIDAPVTFVGYGVTAPELGYDDYQDLDVNGHVVAWFSGAPEAFASHQRAYYSSRSKVENAARRGAIGILSFRTREQAERQPWESTVKASGFTGMRWVNADGDVQGLFPPIRGGATLSPAGIEKLLTGSGMTLEQLYDDAAAGRPRAMPLPVAVNLSRRSEQIPHKAYNVAAILRGSDPALADEYVVLTGHLDHIGVGAEYDGDTIYNGAYDNATGIAIMLEVARAMARAETRPARSVLFLAVTGEEKGLLGSDYFAEHPTVPIDQVVANINLDMPVFAYKTTDMVAFGAEHSSLIGPATRAAQAAGFELAPDPLPEETIFVRSDQYSFVKRGIPALYLMPGFSSPDPAMDGGAGFMHFLQTHYHKPSDELELPFDAAAAERFTLANYLMIRAVADDPARPAWNPGDFFGERFARPAAGPISAPAP